MVNKTQATDEQCVVECRWRVEHVHRLWRYWNGWMGSTEAAGECTNMRASHDAGSRGAQPAGERAAGTLTATTTMERMSNTSIFNSILSLSSALIRNVKNIDLNFSRDLEAATAHASSRLDQRHGSPTPVSASNSSQPGPSATPSGPIPGPIAFATSPFFIGVLLVSFAVNRIQHIVVAPGGRRHRRHAQAAPRADQFVDGDFFVVDDRVVGDVDAPQGTWHTLVRDMLLNLRDRCLPLDPNSPFPRLVLNFPAVYLLGRAAILLLCIIIQDLELWPSYDSLTPLGEWSEQHDMASVCWNVFVAVSVGLVSSMPSCRSQDVLLLISTQVLCLKG